MEDLPFALLIGHRYTITLLPRRTDELVVVR